MAYSRYVIDPLVPMCCLDHYTRRTEGTHIVRGVLLASVVDDTLEIRNSLALPHTDNAQEVAKEMTAFHTKVYTRDKRFGRYFVGALDASVIRKQFEKTSMKGSTSKNVLLQLDPSLNNGTLNPKLFVLQHAKIGGENIEVIKEVPFEWQCSFKISRIALNTMITNRHVQLKPVLEGLPDQLLTEDLQSCTKLKQRPGIVQASQGHSDRPIFDQVHKQLLQVQAVLKKAMDYVTAVTEGKEKEDPVIARELLSIIQSVPPVAPDTFDKLFNNTTQDLLMINYLAKLAQTQVHLMERLHVYIPDTKLTRGNTAQEERD